jgi:hypothetical protein
MSTLSTVGQTVVTGLNSESINRFDDTDVLNIPIGIASTNITYYQIPAKELDLQMLEAIQADIDLINEKKEEIVGLCAQAYAGYIPGFSLPSCSLEPNEENITSQIVSEKGELPAVVGFVGTKSGITGPSTPQIAYGVVRDDRIRLRRYPYLEQRISPNDNALENLRFPILTEGNAGQGKENMFFKNAKNNDGVITYHVSDDEGTWSTENWISNDNVIGRYYKITGPGSGTIGIGGTFDAITRTFSPDPEYSEILTYFTGITTGSFDPGGFGFPFPVSFNPSTLEMIPTFGFFFSDGPGTFITTSFASCNTIASQIIALENEIETLRVGIATWFTEINALKLRKHGYQLRVWSGKRIQARNAEEQVNIGIGTSAIIRVDPELPTSSNTFDDNILTRFDSTNLSFDNT